MNRYVVLTAASLVSFGAFAQQAPSDPAKAMPLSFESLDRNADHKLSETEVKSDAALARSFKAADKNGDGYISAEEFDAYKKKG
jgi:hypothetical protein